MFDENHFRSHELNSSSLVAIGNFIKEKYNLSDENIETIRGYLLSRQKQIIEKDYFGIVYDITKFCNLNCLHCSVDATFIKEKDLKIQFETTFEEVCAIIDLVHDYFKENSITKYFFMFGGGEPFLRPDFIDIIKYAGVRFSPAKIGVNTNGTILNMDSLLEVQKDISILEISLDGFERYHNSWRDPKKISNINNPFIKALSLLEQITLEKDLMKILEVSSIATCDNINTLPEFAKYLSQRNINNYSIHRAIPVGRMSNLINKIPNTYQYLKLIVELSKLMKENNDVEVHIHHSLESIFSALLLGNDIHDSDILMRSGRHSIGIRWDGEIYFDTWCVIPPYDILSSGNLLDDRATLQKIINSERSPIKITSKILNHDFRCNNCRLNCSGGMRINALIQFLTTKNISNILYDDLILGLSQIDPVCPLYQQEG